MKLAVYKGNTKSKDITLSEIWDEPSDKSLHQVVVARLANNRLGMANTKTRSEVKGSTKKPWRQKGLGRARAGRVTSPLWRGGGVTFGPKPRDFSQKINRKQKAIAYIYALIKMNEDKNLKVVEDFAMDSFRTKDFKAFIGGITDNANAKICLIVENEDRNLYISSRNLPNIEVMHLGVLDILPIVYAQKVIITESAIKKLDERFGNTLNK